MSKLLKLQIQMTLVVKGSTFVHGEKFVPVFQILISCFLSICKILIFLMFVSSIWPKYYRRQLSFHVPKKIAGKFSFSELNFEKVKLFTQSATPKFFALTFLTLEAPWQFA